MRFAFGFVVALGWLIGAGGMCANASVAVSYHGIFVIIDPYRLNDMTFLACAAGLSPPAGQHCTVSPTSNPFIATGEAGTTAATGILLRLPWCGFQTDRRPHYSSIETGSCHYRVQAAAGTIGYYYAGQFSGQSAAVQITAAPAQQVDQYIGYLSPCQTTYDECSSGVLQQALAAIATINKSAKLSLSVGLEAGVYTPISVLHSVSTIDLPIYETSTTSFCDRQPLTWQPAFLRAYNTALGRLVNDIEGYADMPPIKVLKISAHAEASLEYNIDARPGTYPTQLDPSGNLGLGIDDDPVLVCPDQLPPNSDGSLQTGIEVLLNDYVSQPWPGRTMAQAYEAAYGNTVGFEAALLPAGAILSVSTTGVQAFAHAACDTIAGGADGQEVINQPLLSSPCSPDPSPGVSNYGWSDYYFVLFNTDLFAPGTLAYEKASTAFHAQTGGHFALTPQQLAIVYTALQPPLPNPTDFPSLLACLLNNTATGAPYAQNFDLYATPSQSDLVAIPGPVIGTPGTLLGWQTATELTATPTYGDTCTTTTPQASYQAALTSGVSNGGKFIEIESDAAGDAKCWTALAATVALLQPNNTTSAHCLYN